MKYTYNTKYFLMEIDITNVLKFWCEFIVIFHCLPCVASFVTALPTCAAKFDSWKRFRHVFQAARMRYASTCWSYAITLVLVTMKTCSRSTVLKKKVAMKKRPPLKKVRRFVRIFWRRTCEYSSFCFHDSKYCM